MYIYVVHKPQATTGAKQACWRNWNIRKTGPRKERWGGIENKKVWSSWVPWVYELALDRVVVEDTLHLRIKGPSCLEIYSNNVIPVMLSLNKQARNYRISSLFFCLLPPKYKRMMHGSQQ
jgi:hypothetical protein